MRNSVADVGSKLSPYKQASLDLICSQKYEQPVFITLATNCHKGGYNPINTHKKLNYYIECVKKFDANISRKQLGRQFSRDFNYDRRQRGILKPENLSTNLHFHGRLDIRDWILREYIVFAEYQWKKIVPHGEIDIQSELNMLGVAKYMSKNESEYSLKNEGGNEIFLPYRSK